MREIERRLSQRLIILSQNLNPEHKTGTAAGRLMPDQL